MCSQSHNQGIMTKSQPKKVNRLQFIIKMNEFYLPFFENFLSSISNDKYRVIAEAHAHTPNYDDDDDDDDGETTENIAIEFRFWKITLNGCSTATTTTAAWFFRVSYVLRINLRHIYFSCLSSSSFHRTFQSFACVSVCHSLHRYRGITQNIAFIQRNRKFFPTKWIIETDRKQKKRSKNYWRIYVTKLVWMINFLNGPKKTT